MEQILQELKAHPRFRNNITFSTRFPAKEAQYKPFPDCLDPRIQTLLRSKGILDLYTHQEEAFLHVSEKKDVVIVTPTASGKTLCYNLPVIQSLLSDPKQRALYLFPTKALAQDQVAELMEWSDSLGGIVKTYTYDGDTPAQARSAIRSAGSIVVTNPDMLHSGILPHHTKWMRLFENLRYIVIDELHSYRGVFGSHVANVLRRLQRICAFYGTYPQFICASATIANPKEHSLALLGRETVIIENNGAPRGPKELLLYNPPVVNKALGIRRSALLEAQELATELLRKNIQTIVFARSKTDTEVLVTYLRTALKRLGDTKEKIRGYRGGYLPKQRREIEAQLRRGEVLGVVSTNALELGVDIGSLQAAIITGYPGTIASTWQQAGRAGRSEALSLVILVGNSSPINQFIVSNPDFLLEKGAEQALIHKDNYFILVSHVQCAAFELPFKEGETFGELDISCVLDFLVEEYILRRAGDRYYFMSENYPAVNVSLRSASTDNFVIVDTTSGASTIIGEVDRFSAPMMIHEGAIYIHESKQYHVDKLDFDEQKAYATEVKADYYTDANLSVELKVLGVTKKEEGKIGYSFGEVLVAAKTHMYKKIRFYTHENIGWGPLHLPEFQMHTTAFWLTKEGEKNDLQDANRLQSALMGTANLIRNTAPLELMCEPSDLGVAVQVKSPFTQAPTIFIYEKYPGGVGFAEKLLAIKDRVLLRSLHLLEVCPCLEGCPSCVGPLLELGEYGKEATKEFLLEVIALESQGAVTAVKDERSASQNH